MSLIFVQIGAGAGDQDARSNFRDGFTEFVKSVDPKLIQKIILVEPNPHNIPALRQCWRDYPQAEIHQIGIRTCSESNDSMTFYYAQEDGPHFQTFSLDKQHVLKHYPAGNIQSVDVKTRDLAVFLNEVVGPEKMIALLSLDIEGIDAEVILDVHWQSVNCYRLSFEYIHLAEKTQAVLRWLGQAGYQFIGRGIDASGFDFMYEKNNVAEAYQQSVADVFAKLDLSFKQQVSQMDQPKSSGGWKSRIRRLLRG